MAITTTSAAERDTLRTQWRARTFDVSDVLLWATSCVALFAIILAYTGRLRVFDASETLRADVRVVNLNTVSDAAQIEPAMAAIFATAADRQVAARELFRFLDAERNAGRAPSNVGAITRATVRLDAIARDQGLEVLARRAQTARESARTSGNRPRRCRSHGLGSRRRETVLRGADAQPFRNRHLGVRRALPQGFNRSRWSGGVEGIRGDQVLLAAARVCSQPSASRF
jgi:hypothetical protein